jgi:hypothetical protein
VGIINIVCGFIIVYKIGLCIFGECNNYKYANKIWIVFPCVIRKTKWNALLNYFLVYVEGILLCGIYSPQRREGEWVLGTTKVSITTLNPPPNKH